MLLASVLFCFTLGAPIVAFSGSEVSSGTVDAAFSREVREAEEEGLPSQESFELFENEALSATDLKALKEAFGLWWPAEKFDFDGALAAAKQRALRPSGFWDVEVEDRKMLVKHLFLSMEKYCVRALSEMQRQGAVPNTVTALGDWNVLLLLREQLTRDRVSTSLEEAQIANIFKGSPRLYPWIPAADVCRLSDAAPGVPRPFAQFEEQRGVCTSEDDAMRQMM